MTATWEPKSPAREPRVRAGRGTPRGTLKSAARKVDAWQRAPEGRRSGDWPRTTRLLPWMLAGFIAMLWLVPFDTITLTAQLPFELKLDRILLPFLVVIWCISLALGGPRAPKLRATPIHVAVGVYVSVAYLSVIFNVSWLNNTLLFSTSLKQLLLLSSYATLLIIVASTLRRSEVAAFAKFSLGLAVVVAIGSLWEFHFHYNPFYQWAHKLLPSAVFDVPLPAPANYDELGRPILLGPTESPLELATMLCLALPIALVGALQAKQRRNRIIYLTAAGLLLAAGFATYRKSSLVMPAITILILACYRPRQLVRLLPFAFVLFVVVHFLAEGALTGVISQIFGGKLATVGTTSHRTSGYEAIRPYVWTHPAIGQGYGSYNANVLRILDSQILMSAVETGVVGLLAYLSMMVTTFFTARRLFSKHLSYRDPLALALGCSAIVFLTSSFLYDTMSFPHGPYIFLTFAGFIAVLLRKDAPDAVHDREVRHPRRRLRPDDLSRRTRGHGVRGLATPERDFQVGPR